MVVPKHTQPIVKTIHTSVSWVNWFR